MTEIIQPKTLEELKTEKIGSIRKAPLQKT